MRHSMVREERGEWKSREQRPDEQQQPQQQHVSMSTRLKRTQRLGHVSSPSLSFLLLLVRSSSSCGRISDTYYCCPLSDVCAQNARDAICVVPGTNDVRTYAYAYTPGSSFASWIIAPIVIGAVCCCAIAALMMWRRRKVQREMMANGGMAPVTVVSGDSYGNYQRRYSNDAPHLAPHALPMATYAQPPPGGSRVPTGVPQTYQDSGVYAGAPNRFTNSGAPVPVALPIANSVVDSSLPQARDDAGLRGEGQPQPYGNQPYGNAY